jgi:hypothetical protein
MKRLAAISAILATALGAWGCTPQFAQDSTAPVLLRIVTINGGAPLSSDVSLDGVVTADTVLVSVANRAKNRAVTVPQVDMAIFMRSYSVRYFRSDGRGEVGVDVPIPISGPALGVVDVSDGGDILDVPVEVVRAQQKLEPPLRNLQGAVPGQLGGNTIILTVIAEICLFGETTVGQVVSDCSNLQIDFADFAGAQ